MNKPISKNLHGVIDYGYALTVPMLPEIMGFSKERPAQLLCRALGAGALTYTVLTKARWGIVPILPFKIHLAIDFTVSCLALATPWIFGFSHSKRARNTMISIGITGLAASLLTNPQEKISL